MENFKHHLKDGILILAKANEDCVAGKSRLKAAKRNMLDDRIHLRIIYDKEGPGTMTKDILRYLAVVKTAISFYDLALLTLGMTAVINQNLARSIYFSNFIN